MLEEYAYIRSAEYIKNKLDLNGSYKRIHYANLSCCGKIEWGVRQGDSYQFDGIGYHQDFVIPFDMRNFFKEF